MANVTTSLSRGEEARDRTQDDEVTLGGDEALGEEPRRGEGVTAEEAHDEREKKEGKEVIQGLGEAPR